MDIFTGAEIPEETNWLLKKIVYQQTDLIINIAKHHDSLGLDLKSFIETVQQMNTEYKETLNKH